jgi:hypothetical protein
MTQQDVPVLSDLAVLIPTLIVESVLIILLSQLLPTMNILSFLAG